MFSMFVVIQTNISILFLQILRDIVKAFYKKNDCNELMLADVSTADALRLIISMLVYIDALHLFVYSWTRII